MNKQDVIEFFDRMASSWDADMIKNDEIIGKILDNAEVEAGQDILDVACGTGVMFPYYLQRGVASVTGIDISPEMAKIAEAKYCDVSNVRVICGEHGGDPVSVEFCHKIGLDYVSCSPFRVPIARLAAAQAAIKDGRN